MRQYLPKKIFNRCKSIPFDVTIFTSTKEGEYKFVGLRDKRKGNESLFYTIPNNINPRCPNIKGFQRNEIDKLWEYLLEHESLTTKDIKIKFPELVEEGRCCISAFWGLINQLFPNEFSLSRKGVFYKIN